MSSYTPGTAAWAENERLRAELNAIAASEGRVAAWSVSDRLDALRDAFKAGYLRPTGELHPLAEHFLQGSGLTFRRLAEESLALAGRRMPADGGDGWPVIQAAALSTEHFPSVVLETARGIARELQNDAFADVLALTAPLQVQNYQESSYSAVDLEDMPIPSARTGGEFAYPTVRMTGEIFAAYSAPARLLLTLQAMVGDERQFLAAAMAAFLNVCARNELSRIAALLTANGNLQDGAAWMASAAGNDVTGAPLTVAGLGVAMAALRETPTVAGEPCNARLAAVAVHPDDEAAVLEVVQKLPQDRQPTVVALPGLAASTYWYAFGAPAQTPAIGRATLRGSDPSGVAISGLVPASRYDPSAGEQVSYPGLYIDMAHTAGLAPLGRCGLVRCAKT